MPAYAAFGDQKYLQPDSSATIVVPDTGIYTVFEGETGPGVTLYDCACIFCSMERAGWNLIIFILSVHRFNPARAADSGLRRRRTAATATWRSALSAMPRSGRCLESCSGRCSGAPTTGGFDASAAGRSRSTRNARWRFTWTVRAVSTRAVWKSAVLSVN